MHSLTKIYYRLQFKIRLHFESTFTKSIPFAQNYIFLHKITTEQFWFLREVTRCMATAKAWISNYVHYKVWDEIIYPFPNFNGCTVEVWELISKFNKRFLMDVITYPCWNSCWSMLANGVSQTKWCHIMKSLCMFWIQLQSEIGEIVSSAWKRVSNLSLNPVLAIWRLKNTFQDMFNTRDVTKSIQCC